MAEEAGSRTPPRMCEPRFVQPVRPPRRRKQLVQKTITVPGNLVTGCNEFNAGLFFECHERFEEIWQEEQSGVRDCYKGLIQIAAGFVHITRGNHFGAERLLRTALGYLAPYRAEGALGFDIERICLDAEDVYARVMERAPGQMESFDVVRRPFYAVDLERLPAEAKRWGLWGFDEEGNALPMTITVAE